jgi:hypothetical protein
MDLMLFLLTRAFKIAFVGMFLFFGVAFTLTTFGLLEPWGTFSEAGDLLIERIKNPWHILGAVGWLGAGALFFEGK